MGFNSASEGLTCPIMLYELKKSSVGLVFETVVLGQGFPWTLQFPLSVSFHQCSVLSHSSSTDAIQS